mgnify:CR=1 FL=1
MSAEYKFENHTQEMRQQSKVKLTDLLSRMNEEKKIERNRNLALSVAAVSAVTVFGIILTRKSNFGRFRGFKCLVIPSNTSYPPPNNGKVCQN